MNKVLVIIALSAALILGAHARGTGGAAPEPLPAAASPAAADWGDWTRPLSPSGGPAAQVSAEPSAPSALPSEGSSEVDVVDAHWMALTMWGEGRSEGEAGMRAVGHVIANRWKAERHGAFVTDTVSEAYQFSCWNERDPNRAAMLNIHALRRDSADHRLWLSARRIAAEILSGHSSDPTLGSLFYHTVDVQPNWSRGIDPVTQIGSHLFFTRAAQASG